MANRTKFTSHARARFLKILSGTANVSAAARAVGMSNRGCYDAKKRLPDFAEAWDEAVSVAVAGATIVSRGVVEAIRRRNFDPTPGHFGGRR